MKNLTMFARSLSKHILHLTPFGPRHLTSVLCLLPLLGALSALSALGSEVVAWGPGGWGQNNVPPDLTDAVAVAAGEYHSMALKADGTVVAWGGDGSDYQEAGDVPPGLSNVVAISAGDSFSLALLANGRIVAWGYNGEGVNNPPGLSNVIAVAAGGYHGLALLSNGTVAGWGQSGSGQITPPADLTNAIAIAAGGHHSLALRADGTVVGWGFNGYHQCDPPAGLSNVVAISACDTRSVAVKADGTVVQWGRFADEEYIPLGLSNVVAVAAGLWHTVALKRDGTVVAWGDSARATIPSGPANVLAIAANRDHSLLLRRQSFTLAEALDATNLVWTTGGAADWFPQTDSTHDGLDAAQGTVHVMEDRSWIATTVTGPLQVNFWWKCFTHWPDYDRLAFYIDDELAGSIDGATDWSLTSFAIPAGTHTLEWNFEVDSEPYLDYAAYLDQVTFSLTVRVQPENLTVFIGQPATLSAIVNGENAQFQWRKNGIDLVGETNAVLQFASIELADAGAYQVMAWNDQGASTSATATLTVLPSSPYILQQPLPSDTVVAGSGIMLSAQAAGASALSYQWQKNEVNLPNETNATLVLINLQESEAGSYRVLVSSDGNTIASSQSLITVLPASAGPGCAGSLDPSFNAGRGEYPYLWPPWAPTPIHSVTPQADGKVVIAGPFDEVQGQECPGIARYDETGWLDLDYIPNPGDIISHRELVQPDGKFLQIANAENHMETWGPLRRFNADGTPDTTFSPVLPEGFKLWALALQPDGKILVAGGVYQYDAVSYVQSLRHPVIRLLPNGAPDDSFITTNIASLLPGQYSEAEVTVYDMVQQADGRIYVGGFFTSINGIRRTDVARLNADGSLDFSFEPDLVIHPWWDSSDIETVSALGLAPDGKLLVAGYLGTFNGFSRPGIARLHTAPDSCGGGIVTLEQTTWYVRETNSQVTVAFVRTASTDQSASVRFASFAGSALAGEDFGPAEGELSFAPGEVRKTVTFPIFNDSEMEHTEGFSVHLLVDTLSNAVTLNDRFVASIIIFDEDSIGLPGSLDETFALPLLNGPVRRLTLAGNGTFIAAGAFTRAGDQPRTGLARFTLDGQLDTSFNPVVDGPMLDMAFETASEKLYIAGDFNHVNGVPRRALARLNADGSVDETFSPSLTGGPVEHLALYANAKIIMSGAFTIQSPAFRHTLARLNDDGSLDASLDVGNGPNATIMSLVVQPDDKILIGGQFNAINGVSCSQIARLNPDGALDPAFNHSPLFGFILDMRLGLLPDGKILVGGTLYPPSMLGSGYSLLRLNPDGTFDPTWHAVPYATVFALQPDGKILINGNQRLFPDGSVDLDYFSCGFNYGSSIADLLLLPNGEVLAGGDFTTAGEHPTPYLVRLFGSDSRNFGPGYLSFTSSMWSANQGAPSVTLQVQRIYGAVGSVSVNYDTADSAATNGLDYVAQSGTLTFADGDMEPKTLTVPLLINPIRDGNASFQVVLSQPTGGARLGVTSAAWVNLIDTNVVIRITPRIVSVNESNQAVAFQVIMSGRSSTPVTCQYATRSGSATADTDFISMSGSFDFGTGPYSIHWFQVPILNDSLVEGPESFTVYLTNATAGAVLRASSIANVIIVDDETPPADIAPLNGSRQTESGQFTLTIGGELGRPYVIEASTNLTTWSTVGIVTNLADWVQFTDAAPDGKQKFYRVRTE